MGSCIQLRCPGCGTDRPPEKLGLAADGRFDAVNAQPNELSLRTNHYQGRARIVVERCAAPLHFAMGIRDMLKARLAQVEQELREAGVVLDD